MKVTQKEKVKNYILKKKLHDEFKEVMESASKTIEKVKKNKKTDKENFDNEYYESFEWFWNKK
tara:strand:+ start:2506 stop:2694 length:189 start_codon:yes stop_codon:yes gene_type:complete